jgi:hypothetical protein
MTVLPVSPVAVARIGEALGEYCSIRAIDPDGTVFIVTLEIDATLPDGARIVSGS